MNESKNDQINLYKLVPSYLPWYYKCQCRICVNKCVKNIFSKTHFDKGPLFFQGSRDKLFRYIFRTKIGLKHPNNFSKFLDMHVNYNFSFVTGTETTNVFFLSTTPHSGADFSCPHQVRRMWARTLQPNQNWTQLITHEYLDFLRNRGFSFTHFRVFKFNNVKTVLIK